MRLTTSIGSKGNIRYTTDRLLRRMLSPLCGLDQRLGFTLRARGGPRFIVAGADLTGVHVLRHQPAPKQGSYHLGGGGIFLEEAVIRTLGETVERYSQFVAAVSYGNAVVMGNYEDMRASGPTVPIEKLRFFSEWQYARADFPFKPFGRDAVIGWLKVRSLLSGEDLWAPAQLLLVGYVTREDRGENWLSTAVTTGGAAHTKKDLALRNCLLEAVQIDSAMGHWYSSQTARRIELGQRTEAIERIIDNQFDRHAPRPAFYWLPNPDLAGMTVACIIESALRVPMAAVGLGSDLRLEDALYKALIEATGVVQLAKVVLLDLSVGDHADLTLDLDPNALFDLDSNVAYYALPKQQEILRRKFDPSLTVKADDLPPDVALPVEEELALMIETFRKSGKELVMLDLTSQDIHDLGFCALRIWSPDTLSLCLPSAPLTDHPRYQAYGGFTFGYPHPYP